MAIHRGQGGAGDATGDATNQALVAQEAAQSASNSATAAANSATNAATSATNAANSATSSATSAASSATSATSASNSATSAANSATAAQTAETNAETAETNANASAALAQDWATKTSGPVAGGEYSAKYNAQLAATSASNASTSASNAASSASSASSSASSASASASTATTKASEASASASAAATSASNAATSESNAASSASSASTSATNAANSATSASNSASSASTSATNAANSASSASTSASNAASSASSASSSASSASTSASNAATSASNAATSEANTASLYDQFDDRYLGSKTSDPTLDNDGNALLTGALYFNSSTNKLRVYNGSSWQDSTNSGTVTSVAMSVPTGLSVTGSPITSSGTLALSYTAGYSIPTDTKQSQWDTAYSWGNHALAGYLTSYTETDPVYTASSWSSTPNNSSNWNTAYGWGNHASAGYLDSGDIGSSVLAYDSNLQSFVNTFTLPTTDGTNGQVLTTNGSGTLSFSTPSTVAIGFGFKNRIINGAMVIDQRNVGASVTPTGSGSGVYTLDRWVFQSSQTGKVTVQQNAGSVTPPAGYTNYLGCTSTSAYSNGATDYFIIAQRIEGLNTADLGWGASGASTVTLSFWVRSSLTGTFGGSVYNNDGTRNYPFSYTISAANTWEQKTITIVGDTTGTWLKTSGTGIQVNFSLGTGTSYSNTAGAWTASYSTSATGATSVVGTNGATFYITGVQLEKGSTATSFDYRPYGTELMLCQRYYWSGNPPMNWNFTGATIAVSSLVSFPVTMRATPTITFGGSNGVGTAFPDSMSGYKNSVASGGNYTPSASTASAEL